VILATSARIGEALGLRIQDVDLEGSVPTVAINPAVKEGHGLKKHYSSSRRLMRADVECRCPTR